MTTLAEVWRAVCPTARLVSPLVRSASEPIPDPAINWVRVLRARVPAFDGLERGDLALMPEPALEALGAGPVEPAALVAELVRSGVPALLLVGDGPVPAHAGAVVEAARDRSLPALRVQGVEPAALERSIIGFLVNRRAELDRQAADLTARVERLALEGHGPDALAGAVGAFLARAVAIESASGSPLVVNAPDGVPGAAEAVSRYLARRRQVALRVPLAGGGVLAILGTESASELERAVADRVAPILALELNRSAELERARGAARTTERLPADGPPWVVIVGRQIVPGDEVAPEDRARLRDRLARIDTARRVLLRGDVTSLEYRLVVAIAPDDPDGQRVAGRVAQTIGRTVAVSRAFRNPSARSAAEAEARATLEAAEELASGTAGSTPNGGLAVARADRLAAYRLLGQLHNLPGGPRLAEALLAPLRVGRPADQAERLATLRAVLAHESAAAAAQALDIHRNTLLYRIKRIEAITGWRLDDPELRFALALALQIVPKAQT